MLCKNASKRFFYPDQQLDAGVSVNIPGFIKISYTLKDGETFWSVLTERGIDLDQVLLLNPDISPRRLSLGETIQLPLRATRYIVKGKQSYDYPTLMRDLYRLQSLNPFPLINLPWPSIPAR